MGTAEVSGTRVQDSGQAVLAAGKGIPRFAGAGA